MNEADKRWDEYSLLQNKIDKIGEFRFRIKNWAVTLMIGAVLGVAASEAPDFYYLLILPVIFVFQVFEEYQKRLSKAFSVRLQMIEKSLKKSSKEFSHPEISKTSINAFSLKQYGGRISKRSSSYNWNESWKRNISNFQNRFKKQFVKLIVFNAHTVFYTIMYLIVITIFIFV